MSSNDCRIMPTFEVISKYKGQEDLLLPKRATNGSAGYDFVVAEDTLIPSYDNYISSISLYTYQAINTNAALENISSPYTLKDVAKITKATEAKPTLVPTGVKAYLPDKYFLQLSVRSSCPLKHWLILANGVGIIDSDYYNNPDNEGHIFFQIINMFPYDILLKKGEKIGQGIILPYYLTGETGPAAARVGGFGSTSE